MTDDIIDSTGRVRTMAWLKVFGPMLLPLLIQFIWLVSWGTGVTRDIAYIRQGMQSGDQLNQREHAAMLHYIEKVDMKCERIRERVINGKRPG